MPAGTVATQASYQRACDECGALYKPGKGWGKYCSDRCRWLAWTDCNVRVNRSVMAAAFGEDWLARYEAAKGGVK